MLMLQVVYLFTVVPIVYVGFAFGPGCMVLFVVYFLKKKRKKSLAEEEMVVVLL